MCITTTHRINYTNYYYYYSCKILHIRTSHLQHKYTHIGKYINQNRKKGTSSLRNYTIQPSHSNIYEHVKRTQKSFSLSKSTLRIWSQALYHALRWRRSTTATDQPDYMTMFRNDCVTILDVLQHTKSI